jgi:DNA polymerase-3 subunit epsilon
MRVVVDTEGTGLFRHKEIMPNGTERVVRSHEPGQPRMAEFAAVLLDDDFNIINTYQSYVQPDGWTTLAEDGKTEIPLLEMPPEAFEANRLSFDFLREHGKPIKEVMEVCDSVLSMTGIVLVGYNQQHDGRQIRGELRRAGMNDRFEQTPNICAMRSITKNYKGQVKKLNGKGGAPRLIDAAAHFGIEYPEEKQHNALEDALVTVAVAKRLHEMGLLLPAEVHYARGEVA